jgi:hypothetical protein
MAESHEKGSVVIVGAGFAGFNAAREPRIDISRGDQRGVRPAGREPAASLTGKYRPGVTMPEIKGRYHRRTGGRHRSMTCLP